jgi:hypothetical protein
MRRNSIFVHPLTAQLIWSPVLHPYTALCPDDASDRFRNFKGCKNKHFFDQARLHARHDNLGSSLLPTSPIVVQLARPRTLLLC